jgi:type I restriction enzyme S subunit
MAKWLEKTLGEVTAFIAKGIPPKYTEEENENTIRVLNQKCNRNFEISYNESRIHDCEKKKVPVDKMLRAGDVLINSTGTGTAGRVAQMVEVPVPTTIDGHMILIRPSEELDPIYYGYAVKSFQSQIEGLAEGSTGQTEINRERLQDEVIIRYPNDKLVQKNIGSFLANIDEKIKTNKEINKNLEQQAVSLFKRLFKTTDDTMMSEVGEIPTTFTLCKIGEIPMLVTDYVANGSFASLKANVTLYQEKNFAYFIRNTDLKSDSFSVFVDQHSYEFLSKSVLYGGEVIISNVGDVGSVFLCPVLDRPMTLGNNIILLRPENDSLRYYLYIWFKHAQGQALIQGIKGGSAQPKFNKTDFKNLTIAIPNDDILRKFDETVSPMFELISNNNAESKNLSSLRDTLLPKLMSGELDVSKIDI